MEMYRILIAALVASCAASASASNLTVGDPAPPIAVAKWVQGDPVTSGVGGLRVVEFWATWCGPCKESIPHLTELSKKFKGQVTFTGVDVFERSDDDVKTVKAFVKAMGDKMAYKVAVDDKSGTMGKTWMEAAHQPGIPTAFVIDKNGEVAWIGHPMDGLEEALTQLVAGKYDIKKAKAEFTARMEQQAKQEAAQATQSAAQAGVEQAMAQAMTQYKAGKKAEALAAMDKVSADHPTLKPQIAMVKFVMVLEDDKATASALVEQEARSAGKQGPYAYLQYGNLATRTEKASKEDLAFGLGLADKALAASPTDPIVDFEAATIYARNGNYAKAISLDQEAIKNIPNASPKIQDRLKQAVQANLTEFQSHKS